VRQALQGAADAAGIGKLTTHAFRHSFRTYLNQTGAPIATQQKLMFQPCNISRYLDNRLEAYLGAWNLHVRLYSFIAK